MLDSLYNTEQFTFFLSLCPFPCLYIWTLKRSLFEWSPVSPFSAGFTSSPPPCVAFFCWSSQHGGVDIFSYIFLLLFHTRAYPRMAQLQTFPLGRQCSVSAESLTPTHLNSVWSYVTRFPVNMRWSVCSPYAPVFLCIHSAPCIRRWDMTQTAGEQPELCME